MAYLYVVSGTVLLVGLLYYLAAADGIYRCALQKGGSAPIMDVIGYGDAVTTKGLNMLYG